MMRSALFVDFDNVFTQLRQLNPDAAERFARQPSDWLRWLTDAFELPAASEASTRRRVLVRRCYLNPNWYQNYRHAFLRAGFEIVDCPPVTSQGKTSTDIHMVLDVIELLQHDTRFDEFIVFSADADFTPVLRKLRRHDRRTTVLAIGFPSAAYQASADLLIEERHFLRDALGFQERTESEEHADGKRELGRSGTTSIETPEPRAKDPNARTAPRRLHSDELLEIGRRIVATVDQASSPVPASRLASHIREQHPDITDDWNGAGTFKQFVRSLELPGIQWAAGSGGKLYDPARHRIETTTHSTMTDGTWEDGNVEMYNLVREVAELTGAPFIGPQALRAVIFGLAEDLTANPFDMQITPRRVSDRVVDQGFEVSQRDVTFLVRGMQLNGHEFGQGTDDAATLAQRLYNQILFLCEREQMPLDGGVTSLIGRWIGCPETGN